MTTDQKVSGLNPDRVTEAKAATDKGFKKLRPFLIAYYSKAVCPKFARINHFLGFF
jgi:hypothetical protein